MILILTLFLFAYYSILKSTWQLVRIVGIYSFKYIFTQHNNTNLIGLPLTQNACKIELAKYWTHVTKTPNTHHHFSASLRESNIYVFITNHRSFHEHICYPSKNIWPGLSNDEFIIPKIQPNPYWFQLHQLSARRLFPYNPETFSTHAVTLEPKRLNSQTQQFQFTFPNIVFWEVYT